MKNKGCFKKGNIPYNKGMKRGSVSPDTEFKKGVHTSNFKGYGIPHICNRTNRKNDIYVTIPEQIEYSVRRRKYINRKRISLARYLWTRFFGEIPKGKIIYNTAQDNDKIEIENLILISRAELIKINTGLIQRV
jgi:hypothetical protein